eukprot:1698167-Rhodomonas_salina.1
MALTAAFEGWRDIASLTAKHNRVLQKVVSRMVNRSLFSSMNRWREACQEQIHMRSVLEVVVVRWRGKTL